MNRDDSAWIARLSKDGRFAGTATAYAPTREAAVSEVAKRFPKHTVEGIRPRKSHDVTAETRLYDRAEGPRGGSETLMANAFRKALAKNA